MVERGVYTEAEQEMIDKMNRKMDAKLGWAKFPNHVASKELMKSMALSADPWNPLWRDDNYAVNTRWGGIIAFPMFQGSFGTGTVGPLDSTPEMGFQAQAWIGEDWEFFKPVYPNDVLKVWCNRPTLMDITDPDGNGPRTFILKIREDLHINQRDELISISKSMVERYFLPEQPKPYSMPEYGYTKEEILYLDKVVRQEEIRGEKIRWWEDVQVGEKTKPVVLGPTMQSDNAISSSAMTGFDAAARPRAALISGPGDELGPEFLLDPDTGLYHPRGGGSGRHWSHYSARAEGEPRAFLFGVLSKYTMTRCVTNWMGNDGFIKVFKWRHVNRNPVGDALIGQAEVINKRIENNEYLVDLDVYLRNFRGNTPEMAFVTVSLLSSENPIKWK